MVTDWFELTPDEKDGVARRLEHVPLSALGLTVRSYNIVRRHFRGAPVSIADLLRINLYDLMGTRSFGQKSIDEIAARLTELCADPDRFLVEWAAGPAAADHIPPGS